MVQIQGAHRPWKVLEFQWSAWKVLNFSFCLENGDFSWKSAWKWQFHPWKNKTSRYFVVFCCFTSNYHKLILFHLKKHTKMSEKKPQFPSTRSDWSVTWRKITWKWKILSSYPVFLYCDTPGTTLKMSLKTAKMSLKKSLKSAWIFFWKTVLTMKYHRKRFNSFPVIEFLVN